MTVIVLLMWFRRVKLFYNENKYTSVNYVYK
jgi:hypothetical protein